MLAIRDANPFALGDDMKARLFIEVNNLAEVYDCDDILDDHYVLIFVFSIVEHPEIFHVCMERKFPICPSAHVMSDGQILKRVNHNIYFNLCDEYIPHILVNRTIIKADDVNQINILKRHPFHSYLWLGDDGEIPIVQKQSDIPLIRTINSSSDKIGLYDIDSYWLQAHNIGLFN